MHFSKLAVLAFAALGAVFVPRSEAAQHERKIESVKGQYVVQLRRSLRAYDARVLEQKLKGKIVEHVRKDMILVERDPSENASEAVKAIRENAFVKIAEPNYIYRAFKAPGDPEYAKQWGMHNSGELDTEGTRGIPGVDIGVERAWDITTGSKDIVVAVVDTGVDFSIPDLKNNAWVNAAEANGVAGVDDDNNGYVDDINGFNFVANNGDPKDDNGHGSHCAGNIGASGGDGAGIVGVNWNVSIMAVKFLDASGGGTLENAIKAIDYARKMGAKISSNSWGGPVNSELLQKAIEDSRDSGQLFVAAAGNDGTDNDASPTFPVGFPVDNILGVAAVDNRGEMAYFSNYGAKGVHVAAPGVNIYSTVPSGFETMSGTSMATPHVAGVAALLLSKEPNLTYTEIKKRLIESSRPVNNLKGKIVSEGIVDAYFALTREKPPADPNDPTVWTESAEQVVSTPHPYDNSFSQTYTITVPGAKRLSVHFSKFETEAGYDKVQFLNSKGEGIGFWSGTQSGRYSPISDGDTIVMKFTTDSTANGYGFDTDKVVYEK